jgi:hypothetical protein
MNKVSEAEGLFGERVIWCCGSAGSQLVDREVPIKLKTAVALAATAAN